MNRMMSACICYESVSGYAYGLPINQCARCRGKIGNDSN